MKKTLIRSGFAIAAAWWGARQLSSMLKDVSRYNAMRAMSGDGPLSPGDVREALYPSHTSTKPTNAPHYGEDAKAPGPGPVPDQRAQGHRPLPQDKLDVSFARLSESVR